MSTFPRPPGFTTNRIPKPPEAHREAVTPPPMGEKRTDETKQDLESETAFIIRTTLSPQDRIDPNILRFIDAYMVCRDSAQASHTAGIPTSAGLRLLRRSDIHECISKLTQKLVMKFGYDESEIVERVKEVAGIDPLDIYNDDGSFRKPREIPAQVRRVIKKWKLKQTYLYDPNNQPILDAAGKHMVEAEILEVEFWDKMKAVELLGREKSLFKENKTVIHDVGANMRSVLLDSTKRAEQKLIELKEVNPHFGNVIDVQSEE